MSEPGLTIIEIDGKMYCALCGMPVLNVTEWKEIHFKWHNKNV